MGRFESINILWPPAGWSQLAAIEASSGQAVSKNILKARIFGLQYSIDSVPLFKDDTKLFRHDIAVTGWEYSILNESTEYPVLSLSVMDRFDCGLPRECFVTDIRSYDTATPHTRRSANRAVSAALFLIKQIAGGNVPDVNRVLRIYKLHPAQAIMYRDERPLEYDLRRVFMEKQSVVKGGC
ncbi:MAG: hypothetical protein WC989_07140 [Micavibrio sp.]